MTNKKKAPSFSCDEGGTLLDWSLSDLTIEQLKKELILISFKLNVLVDRISTARL